MSEITAAEPDPASPLSPSARNVALRRPRYQYGRDPPAILHPLNIIRPKKHASIYEWLEQDNPLEDDEERRLTLDEARREAIIINKVVAAGESGLLDGDQELEEGPERASEPKPRPVHIDYLNKHITDFRDRLVREHNHHRKLARDIARLAAAKGLERLPESQEARQARQEKHARQLHKLAVRELSDQMKKVRDKVVGERLRDHQKQEEDKLRQNLKQQVENAQTLLQSRGKRFAADEEASDVDMRGADADPIDNTSDSSDAEHLESSGREDEDDDSDSDTASESGSGQGNNSDDDLDAEALRQKYSSALDEVTVQQSPGSNEEESVEELSSVPPLEEVDEALLDDSNASTSDEDESDENDDMDDDDSGEEDGSEDEDEDEADVGNSLLGFLAPRLRKEISAVQGEEKVDPTPTPAVGDAHEDGEFEANDADQPMYEAVSASDALQNPEGVSSNDERSALEQLSTDSRKQTSDGSVTSVELAERRTSSMDIDMGKVDAFSVAVPSLLRAELRPYQKEGLDWLARMYANNTNGILADEMGLGKTIQSIVMLAHLATFHEVWGPHLVVVPTSVLLNWEVEFKKFCPGFKVLTYYGGLEERKAKRKGWQDSDKWNVVITSYQIAVSDAHILRRRDWHFLILDEAHNIKNFRSQRWQTLLTFKTQARLLLTGTPLQNSLSELWSLLFFLAPEEDEQGRSQFGELAEFAKQFHRPVEHILDNGNTTLDDESRGIVSKLHTILRPHLLRRIKADVEKQMPKKYEHVTVCRLSKRQRQLYDEFMARADTKESFSSRNYMSIIACLMALRKVCNHPDLFETRSINTSFAMPKAATADFEIKELLVRRRMFAEDRGTALGLLNLWERNVPSQCADKTLFLAAFNQLGQAIQKQRPRTVANGNVDGSSAASAIAAIDQYKRTERLRQILTQYAQTALRAQHRPSVPLNVLERLTIPVRGPETHFVPPRRSKLVDAYLSRSESVQEMLIPLETRCTRMQPYIQRFAFVTPRVTCEPIVQQTLTERGIETIRQARLLAPEDHFHEARMRLSIAFPDKTLIQYDCGKLQQLDKLLRRLEAGGHRALIFTQMTKVLDVLEQFMSLHGHRYLRLDGTTKVERRQILTERFNTDPRILCFILSTRSGGLGINLTGADTVIFYDNDWNPAMDKQCQDRCHRIGQTRDVHIYRFVSEGTIEANILRKSNQKRELDKFIIQEGDFTTDFLDRMGEDEETSNAIDQVLGGVNTDNLKQVEDRDDITAAKVAELETVDTDAQDFAEEPQSASANTPQADTVARASSDKSMPLPQAEKAPVVEEAPQAPPEAVPDEDLDIVEEDGNTVPAPGLLRNIRYLDAFLLDMVREELKDLRFETAEEARRRERRAKRKKTGVPLIRR